MPVSFDVSCSTGSYEVRIAPGSLALLAQGPGERVWLIDEFFSDHAALNGLEAIAICATEHAKSLDQMTDVIVALRDHRATRATALVALGGGVVQDISAFAASIYIYARRALDLCSHDLAEHGGQLHWRQIVDQCRQI